MLFLCSSEYLPFKSQDIRQEQESSFTSSFNLLNHSLHWYNSALEVLLLLILLKSSGSDFVLSYYFHLTPRRSWSKDG